MKKHFFIQKMKNKDMLNELRHLNKISKILNDSAVPKLVTRKQIEINDLSGSQYSVNKNMRFKTSILRSIFYDYSYTYFVVKWAKTSIILKDITEDFDKVSWFINF